MEIKIRHRCSDFDSYRAARVKSLFNVDSGCDFDLDADLPVDDAEWSLGIVVGPSGSGKTSIGREMFGPSAMWNRKWPVDKPIIDAITPAGDFNDVTAALSAVGLGSVPTWLRPYRVLSNGERFRADLARVLCEAPDQVVIDEFSSVVDRQIARFGTLAFAKAWKRGAKSNGGKCVLLTPHYDIVYWAEPDWVFDTASGRYSGRGLWRRPAFRLDVWETDWRYWPLFEPHHYLKVPLMIAASCYVATVDGEPVAHLGMSSKNKGAGVEARACRLVVMPEWQGAGVGMRFLNYVCQLQLEGKGRLKGREVTTIFHTSHPGLCAAIRRDPKWVQVSCHLYGNNKKRSAASLAKSAEKCGLRRPTCGWGGHFRAVQGFRYIGEETG